MKNVNENELCKPDIYLQQLLQVWIHNSHAGQY